MPLGIYWLPRQSHTDSDGDTEQWRLSSKDENVEEEKEEKEHDEDEEELNEEEWEEEVDLNDKHDLVLLWISSWSLLKKLLEMQKIVEEMAGTSSASANSFQRTIFMVELQTATGVVATLAEDNLAVFFLSFTNAQLMVLLTFL